MASVKQALIETLGKVFLREATLVRAQEVSPGFRRLDLEGEALRGAAFTPGDKVQALVEGETRTYTPFAFDPARGALSFLAYCHGEGPGSRWGACAAVGSRVLLFGPRGSIALPSLAGPIVLFGDETSFALARALLDLRASGVALIFEVTDRAHSTAALTHLGIADAALLPREADGSHLGEVERRIRSAAERDGRSWLVFTGQAQSIQRLRTNLRSTPPLYAGQKIKAYWSVGKRGLD